MVLCAHVRGADVEKQAAIALDTRRARDSVELLANVSQSIVYHVELVRALAEVTS
jgi:hypothetical protein